MSFVLSSNPAEETFKIPVNVEMVDGNGKKKVSTFKAIFRRLSRIELKELSARLEKSRQLDNQYRYLSREELSDLIEKLETLRDFGPDTGSEPTLTDAQVCREVMVGFEDVKDKDNQTVEFSESTMEALLNTHPVEPAVVKAFFAATYGAAVKN